MTAWEPRPVPEVTPESEPYWRAASEGRLLLRECADCGLVYHYPRSLCPDCLSDDVSWLEASGEGEVYAHSAAPAVPGWPDEDLPLVVAYVELDEGPRVLTNVDAGPESVDVGTRVRARFVETGEENVAVPVFEPV
jgi:hypothetical protein